MTTLALTLAILALPARMARGQQQPPAAPPAAAPVSTPLIREGALLKVQIVVSRYQGEKKISSQPYTLSVTANGPRATLRMGTQVPVPLGPTVAGPDGKAPPVMYNYKDVGASIDCVARTLDDGRYRLELSMDDSSVAGEEQSSQLSVKGVPQFRSFRISGETAVLRDGQSTQLTSAAEKVTGEVVKVDVTLNVVK
jgi:hypothetical protein